MAVDPDKLVSYGLNIGQVEQQLANNNVNAGGSFLEAGLQQINVRALGLVRRVEDIENTVIKTQNGAAIRVRDIATVSQGPKSGSARSARRFIAPMARSSMTATSSKASCCCAKAPNSDSTLEAIHAKVDELNEHILPPGVKIVPFLDRSNLLHYTTHTVMHNLTEGIILVALILFLFLGNLRGAFIVALTIPFSLLFAAICLDLDAIPANLLSLGALDFGMVVEGAVVMVENIIRHLATGTRIDHAHRAIRDAAHEVQRPVFYSIGIIITAYLPIFTLQAVEGRLFKPMAWTVSFALLGSLDLLHPDRSRAVAASSSAGSERVGEPGDDVAHQRLPQHAARGHPFPLGYARRRAATFGCPRICWSAASSAPSFCRIWMKALSGCAPPWRPAPAPPRVARR